MILGDLITIQTSTSTVDDYGLSTKIWTTFKTINASFQPANLTQVEATSWGITDLASNAKKVYFYKDTTITALMRVVYAGETYEIRGLNHWNIHTVFLAVPVQGI